MGYYSKLSFHELLDEYFEARLDYWKYKKQEYHGFISEELESMLIQNYQDYEAEIEKRMFEYESCKEQNKLKKLNLY